jgi:ABC-type dipeptide/oligopeptide/nickel transport system permease component
MLRYILKRVLLILPTFFGVSIILFVIMHLAPGDPVLVLVGVSPNSAEDYRRIMQSLGLDQPLYIQYLRFLERFFQGDLGRSIITHVPVWDELLVRFPRTIVLSVAAMTMSIAMAIPAGVLSATKQNSMTDNLSMAAAIFGISMPSFWLGVALIYIFSYRLGLTPMSGIGGIEYLILPTITLGALSAGMLARLTRSSMLEVLRQDYVRTARSKGLSGRAVVYKHALKNAMIPVVTVIGQRFGMLLGGAMIVETVFGYPGLGSLLVIAASEKDYPVVQGVLLITTFTTVLVYLLVDILYAYIDPRVSFE